jgi:hypothetical protein
VVKASFFRYFLCRKEVSTRHILLYRFYPDETNIRSAIGGIETSLGITLWEKIATRIASENDFEIKNPKVDFLQPTALPLNIRNLLALHKERREEVGANISMSHYIEELNMAISALATTEIPTTFRRLTKGSGVDLYLVKGGNEYAFDLKTVQINAGSGTKFNDTLMKWVTFRALHQKHQNTNNSFYAHIVIPYDPHVSSDWWTQFGDRAYPLDRNDLKVANEFWNLLSGCENTITSIANAFDELIVEGFHDIYKNSLHTSGAEVSKDILKKVSKVTLLTALSAIPTGYGKKLTWKCDNCSTEFRASIKWFLNIRYCSACQSKFFS